MIISILNGFKFMISSVKKGNEYRLEKYGKPLTFFEDIKKCRQSRKEYYEDQVPKSKPFFEKLENCIKAEQYKAKFNYWDEWTGSRYERRENPYMYMRYIELERLGIYHINEIKPDSVCRSNPVTGYWEEL
jgi:hypothetical protein